MRRCRCSLAAGGWSLKKQKPKAASSPSAAAPQQPTPTPPQAAKETPLAYAARLRGAAPSTISEWQGKHFATFTDHLPEFPLPPEVEKELQDRKNGALYPVRWYPASHSEDPLHENDGHPEEVLDFAQKRPKRDAKDEEVAREVRGVVSRLERELGFGQVTVSLLERYLFPTAAKHVNEEGGRLGKREKSLGLSIPGEASDGSAAASAPPPLLHWLLAHPHHFTVSRMRVRANRSLELQQFLLRQAFPIDALHRRASGDVRISKGILLYRLAMSELLDEGHYPEGHSLMSIEEREKLEEYFERVISKHPTNSRERRLFIAEQLKKRPDAISRSFNLSNKTIHSMAVGKLVKQYTHDFHKEEEFSWVDLALSTLAARGCSFDRRYCLEDHRRSLISSGGQSSTSAQSDQADLFHLEKNTRRLAGAMLYQLHLDDSVKKLSTFMEQWGVWVHVQ